MEQERRCYDCKYLKSAISWWCMNEDAIEWRGTAIPGVCECPFWELMEQKTVKSCLKKLTDVFVK